jgi:hypothetical protein
MEPQRAAHDGRWLISALNAMLENERYTGNLAACNSVTQSLAT